MSKYKKFPKLCISLIGVAFICMALLSDTLKLGGGYPGASFGYVQWIMLIIGTGMIVSTLFMTQKVAEIIAVNLIVLISTLLVVDNILYLSAPYLPQEFVEYKMSPAAKVRYREVKAKPVANPTGDYYHEPHKYFFYYGRPNYDRFDEFGYRNPPGYIRNKEIDVLLLGDSFIEGAGTDITVADYLRDNLRDTTVYSLGVSGQGIPHWPLQFQRYVSSSFSKSTPKVVVLNFYGGNDIVNTYDYIRDKKYAGKLNLSFFRELSKIVRLSLFVDYNKFPRTITVEEAILDEENDGAVFRGIAIHPEQQLSSRDTVIFDSIRDAVTEIKRVDENIKIILSYIPTTEAVYEQSDIQQSNSKILATWADDLNIDYIDPTSALKEFAKIKVIHEFDEAGGHFNKEGYRLYSLILSEKIGTFINNDITLLKENL